MAGLATDYAAQSATEAGITVNGDFSATSWEVYFGTPAAPIDPLTLKYSVTFDNALFYEAASIITVISTNIPYAITFSWSPDNAVMVLATAGTSNSCMHFVETFCAFVSDLATGTPNFVEQSPAGGGGWIAGRITGGVIPEPASWALMIAGFGLTGSALRRRARTLA